MSEHPATFSLRPDLIRRRVWLGSRPMWVVKDPLARHLTFFSEQEFAILCLADGKRTLAELHAACLEQFAPQYISAESLVHFYARAANSGLMVIPGPQQKSEKKQHRLSTVNPLAIRLPGINPDRLLDQALVFMRPLFSPICLLGVIAFIAIALLTVLVNFPDFAESVRTSTSRLASGQGFVALMILISIAKVLHELAHAFACKYFGGEVREMGVMLLVGIPCLYCDVSDAWLLDRRWKRILVSAAGMLAELTMAALAVFVWAMAANGLVRDMSATLVVVCSVTTILFNGNPLLRYDGYYILSDLVGIPNLSAESSSRLQKLVQRVLWPTAWRTEILQENSLLRSGFLVGYAIASGVYRVVVFGLIMWMLLGIGDKFEIGGIFGLLVLLMSSAFLLRRASTFFGFPKPQRTSLRPSLVIGVAAVLMIAIGLVPLPQRVTAPMTIRPTGAQQVFATLPGHIDWAIESGAMIAKGQLIARLRNPEIDRELIAIQSECERLTIELAGLQQTRVADRDAAKRIPLLEKTLEEALKRKSLREQEAAKLVIHATQPGRLYAPPEVRANTPHDHEAWQGTPLDQQNRGAWLKAGTLLGLVGHEASREAIVFLKQQDIELIQADQIVTLRLADRTSGSITGSVVEVAISPTEMAPEELTATGLLPKEVEPLGEPVYQVRVRLADEGASLPIRLVAAATIEVAPASLIDRIGRLLGDAFRI